MAQTETYADFLATLQGLAGETFTTTELTRVKLLANMRARLAYNQCEYWPSFLRINEPRRVRRSISDDTRFGSTTADREPTGPNYSSTNSYNYTERGWATALSTETATSNQDYLLLEEGDRYNEDGPADIDSVLRIFTKDPYRGNALCELKWSTAEDKVLLLGASNSYARDLRCTAAVLNVVVTAGVIQVNFYEGEEPRFRFGDHYYLDPATLTENTSSGLTLSGPYPVTGVTTAPGPPIRHALTTSAAGSGLGASTLATYSCDNWGVLLPTVYVTYRAQLSGTYGDGAGETSAIPREFFEYMVRGTYADFLRAEGQNEKAAAEDGNARDALQIQLERVERTQNHPVFDTRIQTHGVEQARSY